ncbi:amidohydrolase family protein [uncultured Sphaerochaeta sp.]|uniref:amidohydrolase family protein n=1 Tax=uncultured Sphaerochaeta sp. TaxID=886478 RepID=UPI002A0A141C|nr:amidohydrolase family protein [uncultured Sphaerochaeta sp.]
MQIIDAHAHAFSQLSGFGADGELRPIGNGKARWATGEIIDLIPEGSGDTTFTAEALLALMDAHQVEKAVLLQGGFLGFANDYVKQTITRYPKRFTGAATFDPNCRNAQKILDNLLSNLNFRIFKFEMSTGCGIMGNHETFALDRADLMEFYGQIARKQGTLVFDLGSPGDGSNQPQAIKTIANAFPSMPIVICHLMSPRLGQLVQLTDGLKIMKRENIFFDLAALHWKVRPEQFPFPTAQAYARLAADIIGSDHLMWGTDAPSTLCKESYEHLLEYLQQVFTAKEQEQVFYETAKHLYFS